MKKLFSLLFVVFIVLNGIFAATITPETAKQTAVNFFVQKSTIVTANGQRLKMQKAPSLKRVAENTVTENPQFYIFNREDSAGFVIVAADDRVVPILGYADSGSFDPNNIPPNAQKWFENYTQQIQYAITNDLPVSAEIDSMWVDLLDGRQKSSSSTQTVTPLIQTKWDQGSPYNNSCPRGSGLFVSRSVTGCVATAMAQVMNYWEYPITGTGFHSYNHDKYGTLNANFASTTYDWANMPNQLTSSSSSTQQTAVATLMYHCGVSVDMNYGISSEGGSGAYVISSASPVTHCTE
ncbi:MAG: C10 family peptidase, partial [Acholeplasmataceae bacterium]|nr:C10 family peptidase [Acholeplasmataceae bacterium]